MKATFLDLRKRTKALLKALDQNEEVTLLYRGKAKGVIVPVNGKGKGKGDRSRARSHPAFGLWADRKDLGDVTSHVRRLRKGRFDAL